MVKRRSSYTSPPTTDSTLPTLYCVPASCTIANQSSSPTAAGSFSFVCSNTMAFFYSVKDNTDQSRGEICCELRGSPPLDSQPAPWGALPQRPPRVQPQPQRKSAGTGSRGLLSLVSRGVVFPVSQLVSEWKRHFEASLDGIQSARPSVFVDFSEKQKSGGKVESPSPPPLPQ